MNRDGKSPTVTDTRRRIAIKIDGQTSPAQASIIFSTTIYLFLM